MSQKPQIMDVNKQNVIEDHYLHISPPNWSLLSLMIVWGLRFASFRVVGAFGRNMAKISQIKGRKTQDVLVSLELHIWNLMRSNSSVKVT